MFDGIYGYFFGSDASQSTATGNNATNQDSNEWIFVNQGSGRSSPVIVADLEMQELKDEDIDSNIGDKQLMSRQRLRKMRKEISNQTKKQQVRELVQRRKEIEKTLFQDSCTDSSTSSSPVASIPPPKHLTNGLKLAVQTKKKCANIKQPKGGKGDNRKPVNAK